MSQRLEDCSPASIDVHRYRQNRPEHHVTCFRAPWSRQLGQWPRLATPAASRPEMRRESHRSTSRGQVIQRVHRTARMALRWNSPCHNAPMLMIWPWRCPALTSSSAWDKCSPPKWTSRARLRLQTSWASCGGSAAMIATPLDLESKGTRCPIRTAAASLAAGPACAMQTQSSPLRSTDSTVILGNFRARRLTVDRVASATPARLGTLIPSSKFNGPSR